MSTLALLLNLAGALLLYLGHPNQTLAPARLSGIGRPTGIVMLIGALLAWRAGLGSSAGLFAWLSASMAAWVLAPYLAWWRSRHRPPATATVHP